MENVKPIPTPFHCHA